MKNFFAAALFASLFFLPGTAAAQKGSFWQRLNPDSLASRNLRLLPLPIVSAGPETGLRVGLVLDYFYRSRSTDSTITVRPSSSLVSVQYSTRGQFSAETSTSAFTANERWYLLFRGGFIDNYERFWGYTAATSVNDRFLEMRYNRLYLQSRATRNLGASVFAGMAASFSRHANTVFSPEGTEPLPALPAGPVNVTIGGAGLVLTLDRRDNQFSPTRGYYADAGALLNFDLRSGRYAYTTLAFDLRRYQEWDRSVVAVQTLFWLANGEMPLLEKWRLGGSNSMRGLFQGRYRDNNLWTGQAEYRYSLHRLVKLVAFAGLGNTAPTTGRLFRETVQASYGTGVRLLVNKDKKVYFRTDFAWSSNGQFGYYIRLGDAF